jgi:hypothetical protein
LDTLTSDINNGNGTRGFTFDIIGDVSKMPRLCYPFTVVINVAITAEYTGTARCTQGKSMLQFLSWMYQGTCVKTPHHLKIISLWYLLTN